MKLLDAGIKLESKLDNNQIESYEYQLDNSSGAIFDILSNYVYSDKIGTVIREICSNAYDATIESNSKRPFEVYLPTTLSPKFVCRDFGLGLSHEDIIKYYITYGASKRRDSNDFLGAFGVGSACIYAYSPSYITYSYHEGVKSTYIHTRNKTNKPCINLVKKEKTDEPSGLQVELAVKNEDIQEFKDKAKNLFTWWFSSRPKVFPDIKYDVEIILEDEHFIKAKGLNQSWALSGLIAFPIDLHKLTGNPYYSYSMSPEKQEVYNLLTKNIVLKFKIGEVDVAASREQLQYNDSNFQRIKDKCDKVRKSIEKLSSDKIKNCKTLWEARTTLSELNQTALISTNKFEWQGKQYDLTIDVASHKLAVERLGKYDRQLRTQYTINPSENCLFAEKNLINGYVKSSKELLSQKNVNAIYVLDSVNLDKLVDLIGVDKKDVYKLSDYYKRDSGGTRSTKGIIKEKVFKFNTKGNSGLSTLGNSNFWDKTKIDMKTGGYYVEIFRYVPTLPNGLSNLYSFKALLERLDELKITYTKDFYGVKSAQILKFSKDKKWSPYYEYLMGVWKSWIQQNPDAIQIYNDNNFVSSLSHYFYSDIIKQSTSIKQKDLKDFLNRINKVYNNQDTIFNIELISRALGKNFDNKSNIKEEYNKINKKYRLEDLSECKTAVLIHYLNMVQ